MMLTTTFLGIMLLVVARIFLRENTAYEKLLGALMLICGITFFIGPAAIIRADYWEMEKQVFLSSANEGEYLLMDGQDYYYRELTPLKDGKLQKVENTKNVEIKIEAIDSDEIPYVVVRKKERWISTLRKYTFYIPEEQIKK